MYLTFIITKFSLNCCCKYQLWFLNNNFSDLNLLHFLLLNDSLCAILQFNWYFGLRFWLHVISDISITVVINVKCFFLVVHHLLALAKDWIIHFNFWTGSLFCSLLEVGASSLFDHDSVSLSSYRYDTGLGWWIILVSILIIGAQVDLELRFVLLGGNI